MKMTFENNNKTYELIDNREVVSIDDATLNIEINNLEKEVKFNFSILFNKDPKKANPYRRIDLKDGKVTIKLFNFYDALGAFFPDILDVNNDYSLHIFSSYIKRDKIRKTQVFFYKKIENTKNI